MACDRRPCGHFAVIFLPILVNIASGQNATWNLCSHGNQTKRSVQHMFTRTRASWDVASAKCMEKGDGCQLAVPLDANENACVRKAITEQGYSWLGITWSDTRKAWVENVDGDNISYTNWKQGHPMTPFSSKAVDISSKASDSSQWRTELRSKGSPYVCQRELEIVKGQCTLYGAKTDCSAFLFGSSWKIFNINKTAVFHSIGRLSSVHFHLPQKSATHFPPDLTCRVSAHIRIVPPAGRICNASVVVQLFGNFIITDALSRICQQKTLVQWVAKMPSQPKFVIKIFDISARANGSQLVASNLTADCGKVLQPKTLPTLSVTPEAVRTKQTSPKPMQTSPKPTQMSPKPTQTSPKPTQMSPKPMQTSPKPTPTSSKPTPTSWKPTQTSPVKVTILMRTKTLSTATLNTAKTSTLNTAITSTPSQKLPTKTSPSQVMSPTSKQPATAALSSITMQTATTTQTPSLTKTIKTAPPSTAARTSPLTATQQGSTSQLATITRLPTTLPRALSSTAATRPLTSQTFTDDTAETVHLPTVLFSTTTFITSRETSDSTKGAAAPSSGGGVGLAAGAAAGGVVILIIIVIIVVLRRRNGASKATIGRTDSSSSVRRLVNRGTIDRAEPSWHTQRAFRASSTSMTTNKLYGLADLKESSWNEALTRKETPNHDYEVPSVPSAPPKSMPPQVTSTDDKEDYSRLNFHDGKAGGRPEQYRSLDRQQPQADTYDHLTNQTKPTKSSCQENELQQSDSEYAKLNLGGQASGLHERHGSSDCQQPQGDTYDHLTSQTKRTKSTLQGDDPQQSSSDYAKLNPDMRSASFRYGNSAASFRCGNSAASLQEGSTYAHLQRSMTTTTAAKGQKPNSKPARSDGAVYTHLNEDWSKLQDSAQQNSFARAAGRSSNDELTPRRSADRKPGVYEIVDENDEVDRQPTNNGKPGAYVIVDENNDMNTHSSGRKPGAYEIVDETDDIDQTANPAYS